MKYDIRTFGDALAVVRVPNVAGQHFDILQASHILQPAPGIDHWKSDYCYLVFNLQAQQGDLFVECCFLRNHKSLQFAPPVRSNDYQALISDHK